MGPDFQQFTEIGQNSLFNGLGPTSPAQQTLLVDFCRLMLTTLKIFV